MKAFTKKLFTTSVCLIFLLTSVSPATADALDDWVTTSLSVHPSSIFGCGALAIEFADGCYVVGGYEESADTGFITYSHNGVDWTQATVNPGGYLSYSFLEILDVTYGNGKFVAVGYDFYSGHNIYTSTNGATWDPHRQDFSTNIRHVAAGFVPLWGPVYIAIGDGMPPQSSSSPSGVTVIVSYDADIWYQIEGVPTFNDIAYGAGRFVATHSSGVYSSGNGDFWGKFATNAASNVSFCDGQFFVPTGIGTALVSSNGTTWSSVSNDAPFLLRKIVYSRGNYLSSGGAIWSSTNRINWVQRNTPSPVNTNYWTGPLEVAFGTSNAVFIGWYHTPYVPGQPYTFPFAGTSHSFLSMSQTAPNQLNLSGLCGAPNRIEAIDAFGATNQWYTLDTFPLTASPFVWTDAHPADLPSRFYRAVLLP
jgi:hypothetical protein